MCGILAVIALPSGPGISRTSPAGIRYRSARDRAVAHSARQRHRGPDHTGVADLTALNHQVILVQERLSIIGGQRGNQPHASDDGRVFLTSNGEIYNYRELAADLRRRRQPNAYEPRSDCDVILGLYEEHGMQLPLHQLHGMYAFVLFDTRTGEMFAARDPIGIIPMYRGRDADGNLWFASELKCLADVCVSVEVFPPGRSMFGKPDELHEADDYALATKWLTIVPQMPVDLERMRHLFTAAVRTHLHCDASVPFGALLSGGVDSSLVASIATQILRESDPKARLRTFSVGLRGAPDFVYARKVAAFLDSDHTEIVFEVDEALDYVRDVVWHVETYDLTTLRCSVPMLLMSRAIKAQGIRMVLSGEGADEIFGGYLYFHGAPSADEYHREQVTLMRGLHLSDCQRANKSMMAFGVEARVPFLDAEFVEYVMGIRPEDKRPQPDEASAGAGFVPGRPRVIEKRILRAAFEGHLPEEVLWRQKEQFSDGVGYAWIDALKEQTAAQVGDEEFARASELYPESTPDTKEAFYYRRLFEERFGGGDNARTVRKWVPRTDWGCAADPSGRAQTVHQASTTMANQTSDANGCGNVSEYDGVRL